VEAAQALGLRTRMVQYRDRLVALGRLDVVHSVP
jgi:hypothetical protein